MVYKSEDLWAAGSPEPPYKQQILEFLRDNSDEYFTPGQVAEPVFDLSPVEEAFEGIPENKIELAQNERYRYSLRAELVLERLVEEGLVEKRSIRVSDQMDALEAAHPEAFDELDDDGPHDYLGQRTIYYRIVEEDV